MLSQNAKFYADFKGDEKVEKMGKLQIFFTFLLMKYEAKFSEFYDTLTEDLQKYFWGLLFVLF
jgi:hypothetical protein